MSKWILMVFLLASSALCQDSSVVWVASNAKSGKTIAEGTIAGGISFTIGDLDAGTNRTIPQDIVEYFIIHPQRVSEKQDDLCFARTFADIKLKSGAQFRGCFLTPMYVSSPDRTTTEIQYPKSDVKAVPKR
jgi:hypothetical protein